MKKILFVFFIFVLIGSFALVQAQQGIHEPGTGIENPELMVAGQGTGQGLEGGQFPGQRMMAEGRYVNQMGNQIMIQRQENNRYNLEVEGVSARSNFSFTQERVQDGTKIYAELSNGRNAEIKIMPNVASETALQRLRLKTCNESLNCTLELKEVGLGNQTRMAYEIKTQRESRILGLFRSRMNVQAQVDSETGELLDVRKPWWSFLASEPMEE